MSAVDHIEFSKWPCRVSKNIVPIQQMRKLRPERLDNLPKTIEDQPEFYPVTSKQETSHHCFLRLPKKSVL